MPSRQLLQRAGGRVRTVREGVCYQKGRIKICILPLAEYPPLISCAPCAPLLSVWGEPKAPIIDFHNGGCGSGRVQNSVGQFQMRASEAAGDIMRG
jgi:hypothetical protein